MSLGGSRIAIQVVGRALSRTTARACLSLIVLTLDGNFLTQLTILWLQIMLLRFISLNHGLARRDFTLIDHSSLLLDKSQLLLIIWRILAFAKLWSHKRFFVYSPVGHLGLLSLSVYLARIASVRLWIVALNTTVLIVASNVRLIESVVLRWIVDSFNHISRGFFLIRKNVIILLRRDTLWHCIVIIGRPAHMAFFL